MLGKLPFQWVKWELICSIGHTDEEHYQDSCGLTCIFTITFADNMLENELMNHVLFLATNKGTF